MLEEPQQKSIQKCEQSKAKIQNNKNNQKMSEEMQDPSLQYIRLLEAVEQQWWTAYNQLMEQEQKHQRLTEEYQTSRQKKLSLKLKQIQLLHQIDTHKQRRLSNLQTLLTRAQLKYQELVALQHLANQSPFSLRMPYVKLDFKPLEMPNNISHLLLQYKNNFEKQKALLQQEIMKLRIVIRLNQIKQEDVLPSSKTKKSQTSNYKK